MEHSEVLLVHCHKYSIPVRTQNHWLTYLNESTSDGEKGTVSVRLDVPLVEADLVGLDPDVVVGDPGVGKASWEVALAEGSVAAFSKAL